MYLLDCVNLVVQFVPYPGAVFRGTVDKGLFELQMCWMNSLYLILKQYSNLFVELINKLNFLDEGEQDLANSSTNPFGDPDTAELNPFGDPDVEGNEFVFT